jgi:hypothetical protein
MQLAATTNCAIQEDFACPNVCPVARNYGKIRIMSTDFRAECDAFNAFVDHRFGRAADAASLEDALAEFRAYQRELTAARAKVQEAKDSSRRGESTELDIEQLIQEVTDDLAAEGIRD